MTRDYPPFLESAFVITSCDMSTLFCNSSEIVCFVYLSVQLAHVKENRSNHAYSSAPLTSLSISILCKHVSMTVDTSRQLSRRTVFKRKHYDLKRISTRANCTSIPFESILSYFSGFVQYNPAYLFLLISKYGKYTFSNSSLIGFTNFCVTNSAASLPVRWQ